jgi:prevent-host-death family protein
MSRSISLVAARKDLGRIVEEVARTGTPVSLTRRGKIVARIVPQERATQGDALAGLRGSAELTGSLAELTRDLRALRDEGGALVEQRFSRRQRPPEKRRA